MAVTGTAQHSAWQARTLPPVEQLRADLWSIPVPIPHNPLRYVSVYAFAVPGGISLIDTGWQAPESWTALTTGLTSIGADVADVRGVLVTHMHPDHLGLATRVREASGAWVAMHAADAEIVTERSSSDVAAIVAVEVDSLVALGAPRSEAVADVGPPEQLRAFSRMALPDRLLADGELADLTGWSLRAVHTPGHTPGHLCFGEERTGLFFSGDHVLPRISPNISTFPGGDPDPLGAYLASLASVRQHPAVEVLPAHEWRFTDLAARVDELTAHHEHRLAELLTAITEHPGCSAWELAGALSWSRPWADYARRMRIFAVTETDAHLRLLAGRGLVTVTSSRHDDAVAVQTWTAVDGSAAGSAPPRR